MTRFVILLVSLVLVSLNRHTGVGVVAADDFVVTEEGTALDRRLGMNGMHRGMMSRGMGKGKGKGGGPAAMKPPVIPKTAPPTNVQSLGPTTAPSASVHPTISTPPTSIPTISPTRLPSSSSKRGKGDSSKASSKASSNSKKAFRGASSLFKSKSSSKNNSKSSKSGKGKGSKQSSTSEPTLEPTLEPTSKPTLEPTQPPPTPGPTADFDLLYTQDWESPNTAIVRSSAACNMVEIRSVNLLYGQPQNLFSQQITVETFIIDSFHNTEQYVDPDGTAGQYSVSFQSIDLLALGFDMEGRRYLTITQDISPISVATSCNSGLPISDITLRMSVLDDPSGVVPLTGTVIDSADSTANQGPNPWTFNWSRQTFVLDTAGSTNGVISIVWDMLVGSYVAIDNIVIKASDTI